MKRKFKVLAIDGGGIKGLYSTRVLQEIEQRYGDCFLADHFDLICGTSTGGLIALALSLRKKAREVADFYVQKGDKIFPYSSWLSRQFAFIRQTLWYGKYGDKALKKCLEEFLGADTRMEDAQVSLCIPSYNLTRGEPIVFKTPHGSFYRDRKIKMVDVALATSAAPTYFPIAELNYPTIKGLFVDGGVWANNPTLCGVLEALDHFVGEGKEFDSYSVLSIAGISSCNGWKMSDQKRKSFWGWKHRLFETPLDGQNFFADHFMKKLVENTTPSGQYFRIPSPSVLSKDHQEDIDMDKAGETSIKLIEGLGHQQGVDYTTKPEYKKVLDTFFEDQIIYQTTK
ncbi:MAG: hypothetical protein DHS20C18_19300 [Saprospiraceae bacterium]|nr:MAG: hypothetical protein DHS20C18_19300 [Saprospiraceae bacterium]